MWCEEDNVGYLLFWGMVKIALRFQILCCVSNYISGMKLRLCFATVSKDEVEVVFCYCLRMKLRLCFTTVSKDEVEVVFCYCLRMKLRLCFTTVSKDEAEVVFCCCLRMK